MNRRTFLKRLSAAGVAGGFVTTGASKWLTDAVEHPEQVKYVPYDDGHPAMCVEWFVSADDLATVPRSAIDAEAMWRAMGKLKEMHGVEYRMVSMEEREADFEFGTYVLSLWEPADA